MNVSGLQMVLTSPRVSAAVASDELTNRVAEIATALDCALGAVADDDAERQLHKLVWLLCTRSGGDICRADDAVRAECQRTRRCACDRRAEPGLPA